MKGRSFRSHCILLTLMVEVFIDLVAYGSSPRLPALFPDLIVRSFRGHEAIALSRVRSIRLVAMISPNDCPSCYEYALAELNRLVLRPEWMNGVLCCIVGREADAVRFADELRQRYALGFVVVRAGDEEECQRSFLARIHTPVIFLIGEGLRLLLMQEMSPRSFQGSSSVIDSLLALPSRPE
jgi:hypothetical protein